MRFASDTSVCFRKPSQQYKLEHGKPTVVLPTAHWSTILFDLNPKQMGSVTGHTYFIVGRKRNRHTNLWQAALLCSHAMRGDHSARTRFDELHCAPSVSFQKSGYARITL